MNEQELRELVDRLSSAIQRARGVLEKNGRTADAIQILTIACPRLVVGGTTGRRP